MENTEIANIILANKIVIQNSIFTETQRDLILGTYVNYDLINSLLSETSKNWENFASPHLNLDQSLLD